MPLESAPEFEKKISADGNADKGSALDFALAQDVLNIFCEIFHRGAVTSTGFAVAAEIRKNQAVARFERGNEWLPKVAIGRKRVQ